MAWIANFYGSRVAQRITLLFIIASLLPITLFSTLSYHYFGNHLQDEADQKIQHAAQQFTDTFHQRFQLIQNEFDSINTRIARNGDAWLKKISNHEAKKIKTFFSEITLVSNDHQQKSLVGNMRSPIKISPSKKAFLRAGDKILTSDDTNGSANIQLMTSVLPTDLSQGILIATANTKYLLEASSLHSPNVISCILHKGQFLFNCPFQKFSNVLPLIKRASQKDIKGYIRSEFHDKKFTIKYNDFFPNSTIRSPDWVLITGVVSSDIHHTIKNYISIFFGILFLTVIIVLLISIAQVRRVIVPLAKLKEGTQTLANQKFNAKVSVKSGDEFEELANSFNHMSTRLGKQFNALETMARIDRMILSTLDINSIIETVLVRMGRIIPCDTVSIFLTNEDEKIKTCKLYYRKDSLETTVSEVSFTLSDIELALLTENPDTLLVENNENTPAFLKPIRTGHMAYLLLPIFIQSKLAATLILGYKKKPNYTSEDLVHARDLAHRVAVALSNATWEDKLYFKAHYDSLTELPNRLLFHDRLQHALARADREAKMVALLFIDMDRFKSINDSLGHDIGDAFLVETANRLKNCVRKIDTVARLGGDEFTIILPDISNNTETTSNVANIANKIIEATTRVYTLDQNEVFTSASIGIAIYPADAGTYTDLIKKADSAMYHAKSCGKGNYKFYCEELNKETNSVLELEKELRIALCENQFELYYQPRIITGSNQIETIAAIVRWNHPVHGITPSNFYAEAAIETGLVHDIGKWSLEHACKQLKTWHQRGLSKLKLSITLTQAELLSDSIVQLVESTLNLTQIQPCQLELEIPEGTLLQKQTHVVDVLQTFRNAGIKVVIGNFGAQYLPLNYLKDFPIDSVKIDRALIKNIESDKVNRAIVIAIIELSHSLNITVYANGVDTPYEHKLLTELKCDGFQGDAISKPLSRCEFESNLPDKAYT